MHFIIIPNQTFSDHCTLKIIEHKSEESVSTER